MKLLNFINKKLTMKATWGILYNTNKTPVRELFVIISKKSLCQNENQSTAFFTEHALGMRRSDELNSVLNAVTDSHSGSTSVCCDSLVTSRS